MRIGIDARRMQVKPTGVGRYLSNLLHEWSISEPHEDYSLFFSYQETAYPFLKQNCFTQCVLDERFVGSIKTLWEQLYLPLYLKKIPLDVFFSPQYFLPFWLSSPTVVTIHDISYTALPPEYPLAGHWKYHYFSRWAARHAAAVITPSEFSKQEILKHYGIPESKIVVIPLAPERIFRPLTDSHTLESIKSKYGLKGPFFFNIGTILPRRNIPNLLRSFKRLLEKHKDIYLLIVGENHLRPSSTFDQLISDLRLSDNVIWHSYIPEEDLVPLYCAAHALVYPSSYEGFGLPVLEAMACGTPVITTRQSSLPEVAGEAGLYVDPHSLNDLTDAMINILENNFLRAELRQKGLKQASRFSWSRTARETMDVFRKIANTSHGRFS